MLAEHLLSGQPNRYKIIIGKNKNYKPLISVEGDNIKKNLT
jgi:hypothetical protein